MERGRVWLELTMDELDTAELKESKCAAGAGRLKFAGFAEARVD
jgi:hypothetical protein